MDVFRNAWVLSAVAGVASAAIAVGHIRAKGAAPVLTPTVASPADKHASVQT